jgi:RNA polymerase sigma-70 factor (family 1)
MFYVIVMRKTAGFHSWIVDWRFNSCGNRGERELGCLPSMLMTIHTNQAWGRNRAHCERTTLPTAVEDCTFVADMEVSEVQIWKRVQMGEQDAVRMLFESYYSDLCRFALQWVKDADETEEIVQRFFVELWEKRLQTEIEITFRSYAFAAVRNRCLNFIKHQKVVAEHQTYMKHQNQQGYEMSHPEMDAVIQRAIQKLPEQCGRVFVLVKIDGLKYAEVAEKLGISTKTIENHMTKALRLLREELKDYLPICWWLMFWLCNEWMN